MIAARVQGTHAPVSSQRTGTESVDSRSLWRQDAAVTSHSYYCQDAIVAHTISPMKDRIDHILGVIGELSQDLEDDEVAPTEAAVKACLRLVAEVTTSIPYGFKLYYPNITTVGYGDLICAWLGEDRDLVAFISPSGVVSLRNVDRASPCTKGSILNPSESDVVRATEWLYETWPNSAEVTA